MPVLKLGKKPIAGLVVDGINFKLPANSDDMKNTLKLPGAHLFQPEMKSKKGSIMKQWVVVPFIYNGKYTDLAVASIKFVESDINKK